MKKTAFIIILIATVIFTVLFIVQKEGVKTSSSQEEKVKIQKKAPAPDWILQNYSGEEISFESFKGMPLVINSWAAWCPFCVDELPAFAKLQEEFKDKIVVIAINRGEPLARAKEFSDKVGVTGKIILLLDPKDSFYKSIGGFSMPETIFVDKDGFIKDHKRGPMEFEEMRRRVEKNLL